MAYITKRGNSYSVRYTYEDEHGKSCDKWESFPTKEEATNRKKQIEHECRGFIKQYLQKLPQWGRFGVTSVTPFLLLPVHPEGYTPAHHT